MIAYLPSQWSWEFLHNVRGSMVRRFTMVDMCKGIQKDWLQGTSIVLVVGLHMLELRILFKQQCDISLHFSNHRIPSFILFFSSYYFFSFLSFSRIFLLFSEHFYRILSIKHRYTNLQSGSKTPWLLLAPFFIFLGYFPLMQSMHFSSSKTKDWSIFSLMRHSILPLEIWHKR